MKQRTTATTPGFLIISFQLLSLLALSPTFGMEPKASKAELTMFPLTQSIDTWFTQQSGQFGGVVVLKDQEAATLLYHRGNKPIKATDHEHHVTVPRLKFYHSGENSWDMETENIPTPVLNRPLSSKIEEWIMKKAGPFRAVVVLKLDGTSDVYQPSTQQIHTTSTPMVLVNQARKSPAIVGNISYHLVKTSMADPRAGFDGFCICVNGTEWYW